MANDIARAVDSAQRQGSQRLTSSVGTQQFQASVQHAPRGSTGLGEAMAAFVRNGTAAYGAYQDNKGKDADARSNEIIRSLSPEQRRQAIESGTLLYQDDPDAMNMLRYKSGRSAAYDVENEIQTKISSGEFDSKDQAYLAEYRQQRLADASKSYAESTGIHLDDPEFQRGFNEDIVTRNASTYDLFGQRKSKWYQAQSAVNQRGDLAPMLDDPEIMHTPSGGGVVAQFFNKGLETGQFPTEQAALTALSQTVTEAQSKSGGGNFLTTLREQSINLYGGPRKIGDILGSDVLDNAIVKANENEYNKNASQYRDFDLSVNQAVNAEDAATGWNMIAQQRVKLDSMQPGQEMTRQRQQLVQAEGQLMHRMKQDTAKRQEGMKQATMQDNRLDVLDQAYKARIAGENVPVRPGDQAVDPLTTGEFKESDGPTFAAKIMDRINNGGMTQAQQDQAKAAYLNADYEGGPFQTYYKTLITDAQREWANSVRQGEAGDMPRLQELQRAFATNEATIGSVFPEQADFLQQIKELADGGIDQQVLIDAQRSKKGLSQDEQKFRNETWMRLMNDTADKDLSSIPGPLQRTARIVFDGFNERSGNPELAKEKLKTWLQENTVSFSEGTTSTFMGIGSQPDTNYIGRIDKRSLMASPDDVNSWKAGQEIVNRTIQGVLAMPAWQGAGVSVKQDPNTNNILIESPTGRRVVLTKQSLQLIYKAQQQAAQSQAFREGVDDARAKQQAGQQYGGIM